MELTQSPRAGGPQCPPSLWPHSVSHPSPDELTGAPSWKHPSLGWSSRHSRGCWTLFNFPLALNSVPAPHAPATEGSWMPWAPPPLPTRQAPWSPVQPATPYLGPPPLARSRVPRPAYSAGKNDHTQPWGGGVVEALLGRAENRAREWGQPACCGAQSWFPGGDR